MKRIRDKILEVFFSDTWLGAILWFAAAAAMLALVVWFLVNPPLQNVGSASAAARVAL